MEINLEYYKTFYFVAKLNSITLAAQKLFISQPAVSQSIKQLEDSLGCKLFMRSTKGARLTPEGKVLFDYVKKGYETILEGEKKLADILNFSSGEIHIGASDMTLKFFLLEKLEKFKKLYPEIKINVTNAPTPTTIQQLRLGKIDFGVVSSPIIDNEGIEITPVSEIQDVFIVGNAFLHLTNKKLPLEILKEYPVICLEHNTSTRRYVDDFLSKNNVIIEPDFEIATTDLIVSFTERNMGIGMVVNNFAQNSIDKGIVSKLEFQKNIPPRNICVVTHNKNQISRAGQLFLESII